MARLPAFCNYCGAVYDSGINVQNVGRIFINDVKVQCPRCGRLGEIPDGVYREIGDAFHVLSAAPYSVRALQQIALTMEQRLKRAPAQVVLDEVAQEIPEAKTFIDHLHDNPVAAASLLIAILNLLATHGGKIPWGDLERAVRAVLTQVAGG